MFNSLLFPYDLSIHINVNPKLFKILLGFKISDICRLLRRMTKKVNFPSFPKHESYPKVFCWVACFAYSGF